MLKLMHNRIILWGLAIFWFVAVIALGLWQIYSESGAM